MEQLSYKKNIMLKKIKELLLALWHKLVVKKVVAAEVNVVSAVNAPVIAEVAKVEAVVAPIIAPKE